MQVVAVTLQTRQDCSEGQEGSEASCKLKEAEDMSEGSY